MRKESYRESDSRVLKEDLSEKWRERKPERQYLLASFGLQRERDLEGKSHPFGKYIILALLLSFINFKIIKRCISTLLYSTSTHSVISFLFNQSPPLNFMNHEQLFLFF